MAPRHLLLIALLPLLAIAGPNAASFIGSQSQQNAEGAVGSIVNMECKTEGSCKGAAKIRGNSKQTQNIGKGGKGTLSNKGKRRKRSPDDLEFMPESIDSQTQNVKTGGQGAVKNVHNKGSKNTGPIQHIGRQTQNVAKGAHGLIHNQLNHKKRGKRSTSFIGSQSQDNANGAVGSIINMECKTKGSCKGAAKIQGNSKQTQNIKAGGKGTLANSGKRRKRSPNIVNMQCNTKGSCKGAVKIRGNSAQTQNIGKGGKGTLSNKGKRRRRSPDDEDDKKSSDKKAFIGKQVVKNQKGAKSSVKDCKDGKCKTSKLGKGKFTRKNVLADKEMMEAMKSAKKEQSG